MKKILCAVLLSAAFLTAGNSVFAQVQQTDAESSLSPKFGIKGGLNLTNMYVKDVSDENMKVGWNAGFFAKLPVTRGFSIQPELLYTTKGAKETYDNFIEGKGEYRFNLNYIELPLLAVFNVAKNFNIHAGPYGSYLIGANIKDLKDDGTINHITDLDAENFNRFDWGLAGGFGIDISNFTLGARYNYGFREIGKSGSLSGQLTKDSKNSAISLYIGLGF
ncbi:MULTISPECIES: porin family protein [Niastella]|uniref:PorT family protein n=1 Tax=Niastella soli TaxID=2821487 RepID=A0ABS3YPW7_9BACT|nr:porin family protein [Niastella soli]MBO9199286.1 PorT family protein [Niastella soli]